MRRNSNAVVYGAHKSHKSIYRTNSCVVLFSIPATKLFRMWKLDWALLTLLPYTPEEELPSNCYARLNDVTIFSVYSMALAVLKFYGSVISSRRAARYRPDKPVFNAKVCLLLYEKSEVYADKFETKIQQSIRCAFQTRYGKDEDRLCFSDVYCMNNENVHRSR